MASQNPIRIAQVIGESQNGGVEAVIRNYYQYIDKSQYQFDFYVTNTSKIIQKDKIEEMGGRVFLIPHYKTQFFKFKKSLYDAFKQNHYLIVHSNMNTLSCFVLREAEKAGVPIRIAHSHSTSNSKEKLRNLVKNILRKKSKKYATDYFACSEVAGRWLFGDETYDSGKVKLINNGVDIDKFKFNTDSRNTIRQQYHISKDTFVLGNVGRLVTQKNQMFLLDVFSEVQKSIPDSVLVLLGEGPLLTALQRKANELSLGGKVIFAGVHEHPEKFYSAFDAFLFPSIYEGLGLSLIEAQVSGVPCILSDQVPREAKVLSSCKVLSLDSASAWAQETIKFKDFDKEKRNNAYLSFVGGKFDLKKDVEDLKACYDELVQRNSVKVSGE